MAAPDRLVQLGVVTKVHGVRGEVSVRVEDPDLAEELACADSLQVTVPGAAGECREMNVESARRVANGVLVKFESIDDREAAVAWRGAGVFQWRSKLTAAVRDELFSGDLLGLRARTPEGQTLGTVESLGGAGEILILEIATGAGELQVPLAVPFVHEIDLAAGEIVLTPPEEE